MKNNFFLKLLQMIKKRRTNSFLQIDEYRLGTALQLRADQLGKQMALGIEYHIQFPEPVRPKDDFVIKKDEKPPVVFLLGWIGCKDKNLARYSNLYNDRGCITLRCLVPVSTLTMQHTRYPLIARKLLDLIPAMSLDDNPIFFHVFSNGGCYLYQYLVNEMRLRGDSFDVRGCIMDSAPGKIRISSTYRAIMALPVAVRPLRVILALNACIWMWILHGIMIILNRTVNPSYLSGDVWDNLLRAPTHIPQLFIYSEDDELVRCEDIEEFIQGREGRGVKIMKCKFVSSPHVMHLRTHEEKYINVVGNFLRSCT